MAALPSDAGSATTMLAIENLGVCVGENEVVLDVSLTLDHGEVLGLVGESGSGKSVSSLAILGLLDPAARVEGSIRWQGRELVSLGDRELRSIRGREIAMIFQEPMTALNPVMRVGRQIAEAILAHAPKTARRDLRERVLQA